MGFSEAVVKRQSFLCQFLGSGEDYRGSSVPIVPENAVTVCQADICQSILRVSSDRFFEVFDRRVYLALSSRIPVVSALKVERVRLRVLCLLLLKGGAFSNTQPKLKGSCDLLSDVSLD